MDRHRADETAEVSQAEEREEAAMTTTSTIDQQQKREATLLDVKLANALRDVRELVAQLTSARLTAEDDDLERVPDRLKTLAREALRIELALVALIRARGLVEGERR